MRIAFEFRPTAGCPPLDWAVRVPEGVSIRRIDAEVAARLDDDLAEALGHSWFDAVWGGVGGFLSGGFGFVAEHDGEGGPRLASNCRQWGSPGRIAPIQVSTRAVFRGLGLATLVSAAFVEEALRRGLEPGYGCEADNRASIALAARLGFLEAGSKDGREGGRLRDRSASPPDVTVFGFRRVPRATPV